MYTYTPISSVQFSRSVGSDSLRPRELQYNRPPCPSPTPEVHPNSCPLSRWCHSSHLILCRPLLLLPPIPPSIRVFSNGSALHIRWLKYWSFSFSISPSVSIQGWFPSGLTGLIILLYKGLSRVFSSDIVTYLINNFTGEYMERFLI